MCRLLGMVTPSPATVQAVLGQEQRQVFIDMARLHRDGWGTAWLDEGLHRTVRPASALGDAELQDVLTGAASSARIVHLRMATQGLACSAQNTHPFVADGMAFAHNGSLEPVRPIEWLLDDERRLQLTGTTDSERYFAAIRTRIAHGAPVLDAILDTVTELRRMYPDKSLNALLLTQDDLFAIHASEHVPIPYKELAASGIPDAELPLHHLNAYFQMRMRRHADGSVLFASSGLDISGWSPLPPESVTAVALDGGRVETTLLDVEHRAIA